MATDRSNYRQLAERTAFAICLAVCLGICAPTFSQAAAPAPAPAPAAARAQWMKLDRETEELISRDGLKSGQDTSALASARAELELAETQFGADDPDTLTSLERVYAAKWRYLGWSDTALLERVLATRTRLLGRHHPETLRSIKRLATAYSVLSDEEKPDQLYRELYELALATRGAAHRETLRARYDIAVNLVSRPAKAAESERILKEVLAEQRRVLGPDDVDVGDTASSLAVLYLGKSRFSDAEPLYLVAIRIRLQRDGGRDPGTTLTMGLLGDLYLKQGRYDDAAELFQRAYDLRAAADGPNHLRTLQALNQVAEVKLRLGQTAEAETLFRSMYEAQRRDPGRFARQLALNYLVSLESIYRSQGRYVEADEALKQALAESDGLPTNGFFSEWAIRRQLADSLRLQGKVAEAQLLIDQVRGFWQRALEKSAGGESSTFYMGYLARLACAYGPLNEGVQLYRKVLPAQETLLGQDSPEVMDTTLDLANCLSAVSQSSEALPLLQRVAEVRERTLGKEHPNTILALNSLAVAKQNLGQFQTALPLFKRAAENARAVFGGGHPATVALFQNYLSCLSQQPGTEQERVAAARVVVSGLRQLYRTREGSGAAQAIVETAKRQQAEQYLLLPDAFIARTIKGPNLAPAEFDELYAALQDATSGTANIALGQAMVRKVAATRSREIAALVRQRQDLIARAELNDAELVKAAAATDELAKTRRVNLQKNRTENTAQLGQIDARLRAGFPEFFDILQSAPATLDETHAALGPDEAILLVIPSQLGTHLMAISSTEVRWAHSVWTKEKVGKAVMRLLWDVGADVRVDPATERAWAEAAGGRLTFDRATAHALYAQVVEPVATILAGKRHVFIAAGGALSGLPFGVLVTDAPEGSDSDPAALRETPWFADAHDLTVIPSIQSLLFQRHLGRGGTGSAATALSFAGYGDPVLGGQAQTRGVRPVRGLRVGSAFQAGVSRSGEGMVDVAELNRLARLPGTATELEGIRKALDAPVASLHLAAAASESAVKHADLSSVRILAFATHGLMAGELSGASEPGLVFTPPTQATADDDGLLTASEVAALKLDADWVILSACNTAAGDGSEGAPGLSGLARSFFYAGARSLLVSHWPVRDDVAAQLTVDAVKLRQANPTMRRSEALQRAMRTIRNDRTHDSATDSWAHPNAWAPFSLVSDGAR